MGSPEKAYPVIHVTGTNGKGSTTRMIAALLEAEGVKAGAYTSPHLRAMNERMSIANEPISDDDLAAQLAALAELEAFVGIQPTWFELVTAAAFRWFADEAVEAGVIEVGLGGRFDATNVADGSVAVVTNVQLDHTDILGDTRESIAWEKAGIVKEGAVLVLGEQDAEIAAVFEAEAERCKAASVWRRGSDFGAENPRVAIGGRVMDLYTPAARYEDVFLPLHGAHQADNAAIALAAVQAFLGDVVSEDVVREAFSAVSVPGRLEVVARRPLVVLDGAHNPAGAAATGAALGEDFAAAERIYLVIGSLRNRDATQILTALSSDRLAKVIACTPPSPRALPGADLAGAAGALGLDAYDAGEVAEAVGQGLSMAGASDMVLVTGSLYVVGAASGLFTSSR